MFNKIGDLAPSFHKLRMMTESTNSLLKERMSKDVFIGHLRYPSVSIYSTYARLAVDALDERGTSITNTQWRRRILVGSFFFSQGKEEGSLIMEVMVARKDGFCAWVEGEIASNSCATAVVVAVGR